MGQVAAVPPFLGAPPTAAELDLERRLAAEAAGAWRDATPVDPTADQLAAALDHLEALVVAGPYGRSRDRVARYEEARAFLRLAGRQVAAHRPRRRV